MKIKKLLLFFLIGFVLFCLIIDTKNATNAAFNSLVLCARNVIPTLFPFFVISGLLVNTGIVAVLAKILTPVSKILFKTSGNGSVVFLMGIICGYPTGAKVVSELYCEGSIEKNEGERLLAFCNNSGPLFVIGAVGEMMLGNHKTGVILYIIHVISAILTGFIFGIFSKRETQNAKTEYKVYTIGEAMSKSIESAVKSILNVCGYVVFFGVLISVTDNLLVTSLLEVTNGAKKLSQSGLNAETMLMLISATIGFGGICVLLQVESAVSSARLSIKLYALGKVIQAILSAIITKIYLLTLKDVTVFSSVAMPRSTTFDAWYVMLFLFLISTVYVMHRLTKKR